MTTPKINTQALAKVGFMQIRNLLEGRLVDSVLLAVLLCAIYSRKGKNA